VPEDRPRRLAGIAGGPSHSREEGDPASGWLAASQAVAAATAARTAAPATGK